MRRSILQNEVLDLFLCITFSIYFIFICCNLLLIFIIFLSYIMFHYTLFFIIFYTYVFYLSIFIYL